MSAFWSAWVMFLVTLNLGITFFLFIWGQRVKIPVQPDGSTGHVWAHGVLRESVRRLPRWWVLMSASLFAAAFIYLVLFPGFGSHKGLLGWTSHAELARDVVANESTAGAILARYAAIPAGELAADPAATRIGKRLFIDNCSACHAPDARGNKRLGAPDLTDAHWRYGGDDDAVKTSILEGRSGLMPPLGAGLEEQGVLNLAHYVLSLSGAPHDAAMAAAGAPQFALCAACHGPNGKGNVQLGAPDLTDATWQYGGTLDAVVLSIMYGRHGVMPAWKDRLRETDVHLITAWLHSQSHGDGN